MMDFSKFRESGDLSDITVVLDKQEHKLHKFPLYARSDHFCELARSRPGGEADPVREELWNFPGGNEIFGQVADFCYNMPVNMNKGNIVAIRSAAEYLKMFGPGNLVEVSEKYLGDTMSAAKLNRATPSIIDLLMQCKSVGDAAKVAGVVDSCINALVECWLKPSVPTGAFRNGGAFTKVAPTSHGSENLSAFTRVLGPPAADQIVDQLDEQSISSLVSLCPEWFATILSKARNKGVSCSELGALAVRYVSSTMDADNGLRRGMSNGSQSLESDDKPSNSSPAPEKDTDTSETVLSLTTAKSAAGEADESTVTTPDKAVDLKQVLDKVLLVLPEEAFSIPAVTMEWLTKVLRVATAKGCECRGHLVRVAGEMLTRLGPEDLCIISPSVLHDIVVDAEETGDEKDSTADDSSKAKRSSITVHRERACKLVDTYMAQMSSKGVLTAETFRLLASATKNYPRTSHDSLYDVLEFVLKSEKDCLSPQQRKELADVVNFDLVSETHLQRALEEEVAPGSVVAGSAIKLCGRLRSELASIKYIAETQEEEIQKYQKLVTSSSSKTKQLTSTSPPQIVGARHLSSFSSRDRNLDLGYPESTDRSKANKSPRHEDDDDDDEVTNADDHLSPDPMEAAQNVLSAARHKLALPIYTGYRPALLTRLSPNTVGGGSHTHGSHHYGSGHREHDITLEDELEFKFDRTFRSLDPRVRHQRVSGQPHHHHYHHSSASNRTYFPYSHYTSRF